MVIVGISNHFKKKIATLAVSSQLCETLVCGQQSDDGVAGCGVVFGSKHLMSDLQRLWSKVYLNLGQIIYPELY